MLLKVIILMSILFSSSSVGAKQGDAKIVIVGAGLAGLTAAYRLHAAGKDVELYDARNRVGGRVYTVSINGGIAELGAQNITDGGEAINLHRLIEEFGLELTSNRVNINHSYYNGRDLTPLIQLFKSHKYDLQKLRNDLDSYARTAKNMKELLENILEESDPLYKVIAVRLAAYEGASVEKLSPLYVETLFHMLQGGICAVHQGSGIEDNFVDLVSIKGGNSLLPEKMAKELGGCVHLNRALKEVSKDPAGNSRFKLTFDDGEEVNADVLVLAIPCSVYKTIYFDEEIISLDRLKTIQNVPYGTNAKIMLSCSCDSLKNTGLISDQIICFLDVSQNILTVYYTGSTSFFTKDTIQEAYSRVRPMIEMGFGKKCPVFEVPIFANDQSFKTYHAPVGYSWPNDPYAQGTYSYIAPGQESLLTSVSEVKGEKYKTLFSPIGDHLYFAGEHASILLDVPGTMEAACESGERVARAILKQNR